MDLFRLDRWSDAEVIRFLQYAFDQARYYKQVLAAVPTAVAIVNRSGAISFANPAFRSRFALTNRNPGQRSILDVIPSPNLRSVLAYVFESKTSSDRFDIEFGGASIGASVHLLYTAGDEGDLDAVLILDAPAPPVEPHSPPEEPESDFSPGIPFVLWTADAETLQYESVEGAVEELLGYPATHWLNEKDFWLDRIHADEREATALFIKQALKNPGCVYSCEFRAQRADSNWTRLRESFRVVKAERDRLWLKGVTTDAGDLRQAREREVQAERLQAASESADLIARTLGNPLRVIQHGVHLLASKPATERSKEPYEAILHASTTIFELMRQIEPEPNSTIQTQRTELSRLIRRVQEDVRNEFPQTEVLTVACSDQLWITADSAALERLIQNACHDLLHRSGRLVRLTFERELFIDRELLHPGAVLRGPGYVRLVIHADLRAGANMGSEEPNVDSWLSFDALKLCRSSQINGVKLAPIVQEANLVGYELLIPKDGPAQVPPRHERREITAPVEAPIDRIKVLVVAERREMRHLIARVLTRHGYEVVESAGADDPVQKAKNAGIRILVANSPLMFWTESDLAQELKMFIPEARIVFAPHVGLDTIPSVPDNARVLQVPFTMQMLLSSVAQVVKELEMVTTRVHDREQPLRSDV